MSTEEDEENRLCQCIKKYKTIVKQIDELVEIVDVRTRPPKRRKNAKGSNSTNDPASTSANQPDNGEVLVETITRFLHELNPDKNPNADPNCSTSSRK